MFDEIKSYVYSTRRIFLFLFLILLFRLIELKNTNFKANLILLVYLI